jgi:hypothetical protein
MMQRILLDGAIAGVISTGTGYFLTGRLFHSYQARTPEIWRSGESWSSYLLSSVLRLLVCIVIAWLYSRFDFAASPFGRGTIAGGALFGLGLGAITVAPALLEAALFVKWHPGFVVGLVLDWLIVFMLAGIAGSVAVRVV